MAFSGIDRRTFQLSFIYGAMSLIGAALAVPAAIYLFSPGRNRNKSEWIDVGDVSQFKLHEPEEVVFRRNRVDGWKVASEKTTAWVVRVDEKKLIALAPQCTHLGCAYHWEAGSKHFVCPCHTSAFSPEGKVLAGPAPRPLDRYVTRVDGSKLMVGDVVRSEMV